MDKKNTFLGLIFIVAGIGFMFWQSQQIEKQRIEQLKQAQTLKAPAGHSTTPADTMLVVGDSKPSLPLFDFNQELEAVEVATKPLSPERTIVLRNDYIEAVFTTRGGAIQTVSFLQTKRGQRDDYVFNKGAPLPALSLSLNSRDGEIKEYAYDYLIEQQSSDSVTFVFDNLDGLNIRREYRIASTDSEDEPYTIEHTTVFTANSASKQLLSTVYFNLGTARPITEEMIGVNFLNVGYFDGQDAEFIPIKKLTGGKGFLGIGASDPKDVIAESARIKWSSVKNQFFASVLSSGSIASDVFVKKVDPPSDAVNQPDRPGISGSVGYEIGTLAAGESKSLDFKYFVGPKEFKRLQAMGSEQDLVMQFGFLGFFSKLLLAFMYLIHSVVPSWGWSIVITTICIKLLFWPLTAKASRSQKRMASIQGPMAELKEKYKDNPQKMQQETLKLFKEHQVNPVAGCLPMLIQMPIFLGLFYMLRTASELRFEPFLWVSDLSLPDTQFSIEGFPINILPMIMGVTMFLQMSMMPVSPTADPMQQKIFKFLPFIFLIFLYNFSSGLVLYWTVQNILTIIQQKIINSRPDEPLKPVLAAVETKSKGKSGAPRTKPKRK